MVKSIIEIAQDCATEQGLVYLGMAKLGPDPNFKYFDAWLAAGHHAGMEYLSNHRHCRSDPSNLLAGGATVFSFGMPYYQGDRLPKLVNQDSLPNGVSRTPQIAQYARLKDYHRVLRRKCEDIAQQIVEKTTNPDIHATRVVVDSAPLLERSLAAASNLGFIGKNTCYIHPKKGSFLLLAEVLTTISLEVSSRSGPATIDPAKRSPSGGCGTCRRCQVHCPTGALDSSYTLDANKCLAYWTIEHRGLIPERYWPWLGKYLFGCDICQLVCPYNRRLPVAELGDLRRLTHTPPLYDIATMDQQTYEKLFGGTPLTRAKKGGLQRNALLAMLVTQTPGLRSAMKRLKANASSEPSVVAGTIDQMEEALEAGRFSIREDLC